MFYVGSVLDRENLRRFLLCMLILKLIDLKERGFIYTVIDYVTRIQLSKAMNTEDLFLECI